MHMFSNILFLMFVIGIPLWGMFKRLDTFSLFVQGAKQGFELSVNLIPYLIAMLVAIGMLRASGFFELLIHYLGPFLSHIGVSPELLSLMLIRPFSGSASLAILAELSHTYGGDSLIAKTAATMIGSTETTFYVIAIYFGAIQIRATRHAIPSGLLADVAGMIASIVVCRYLFG